MQVYFGKKPPQPPLPGPTSTVYPGTPFRP
jgi:hypothetical protein